MDVGATHPAVERLLGDAEFGKVLTALTEDLAGADLTSLLMEVARRRASALSPREVLAQYRRDRFMSPAAVDGRRLREIEDLAIDATSSTFELVVLSPVAPLGTHSVVAGVSQNRVLTTVRAGEVAADPTNALALEAAVRRGQLLEVDRRSTTSVRLCAVQRVVRAQRFDGPASFPHFELLGAVTAGRDTGSNAFEISAMIEHVRMLGVVVRAAGAAAVRVRLTDFDGRFTTSVAQVGSVLAEDGIEVRLWPERTEARDYYRGLCFKLDAAIGADHVEVRSSSRFGIARTTSRLTTGRARRPC
jgi:hypothetical protein